MLRFQGGDRAAFEELVRRNTPKVHALIYRFLGEPDLVDDLTQEVFLRVYRTADRYLPRAKFSTWLYRITANLCFNVLRQRKRMNPVPLDAGEGGDDDAHRREVATDSGPAPHAGLDREELRRRLTAAIAALPDNQRIAILLNKYEDKSYEEIAAVLQCTTMAVKSLLSRARANLRHALFRYMQSG